MKKESHRRDIVKILFSNFPYYGHVVPTIGLVQELIKQGCEVTYLMPLSVLFDRNMKDNLAQVKTWIKEAPGNKGGAEFCMCGKEILC